MNTQAYKGIPKHQSSAYKEDRSLYNTLGADAYVAHRADRAAYYADLIRQVREAKG